MALIDKEIVLLHHIPFFYFQNKNYKQTINKHFGNFLYGGKERINTIVFETFIVLAERQLFTNASHTKFFMITNHFYLN